MASPSEAEVQNQIGLTCKLLNETQKFGSVNTPNFVDMLDAIQQAQEGDYSAEALAAAEDMRGQMASTLGFAAGMLTPYLQQYAKVLGIPYADVGRIFRDMRADFVANAKSIKTRALSFGTPSFTGTGLATGIHRLTVDADGKVLENQTADTKTITCRRDRNSGADRHVEVFEFAGGAAEKDLLEVSGSGRTTEYRALDARDSQALISNPSFSDYTESGAAGSALSALDDWTVTTDVANLSADLVTYRDAVGDTNPAALEFGASDTITQVLNEVAKGTMDPDVPYHLQVAVKRKNSATGTLTLNLGSVSASVDLSTLTNDVWTILALDLDKDRWFREFNQDELAVSIAVATLAVGEVQVDDIIFAPMSPFDGSWYALVGGATPYLVDDVWTIADTETGAIIAYWLWLAFGEYLPTHASPTWADPV